MISTNIYEEEVFILVWRRKRNIDTKKSGGKKLKPAYASIK